MPCFSDKGELLGHKKVVESPSYYQTIAWLNDKQAEISSKLGRGRKFMPYLSAETNGSIDDVVMALVAAGWVRIETWRDIAYEDLVLMYFNWQISRVNDYEANKEVPK
jgi:hypothetical protein